MAVQHRMRRRLGGGGSGGVTAREGGHVSLYFIECRHFSLYQLKDLVGTWIVFSWYFLIQITN